MKRLFLLLIATTIHIGFLFAQSDEKYLAVHTNESTTWYAVADVDSITHTSDDVNIYYHGDRIAYRASEINNILISAYMEPVYMYTGNTAEKPTVNEVISGSKYDYNSIKEFITPIMTERTIWLCLPSTVTLVSAENSNFAGDFIHSKFTIENIAINNSSYKLYYIKAIATKTSYKVIVK